MKVKAAPHWPTIAATTLLLFQTLTASLCVAAPGIDVHPDSIRIGAFYDDTDVEISAKLPPDCDAVVEILGKDIEEQLLRKGRHWDIWMNVGEIDIEGAPHVYFAASSDPQSLSRTASDAAFGYHVLRLRTSFIGDVAGLKPATIFDEFIKLKESERLYRVDPGGLQIVSEPGVERVVQGGITIPSRIPPGTYKVLLSVLKQGHVVETRSASLEVLLVGLPAMMSNLARRHGTVHGLLAISVALGFGYFIGVIFKKTRDSTRTDTMNDSATQGKKGG